MALWYEYYWNQVHFNKIESVRKQNFESITIRQGLCGLTTNHIISRITCLLDTTKLVTDKLGNTIEKFKIIYVYIVNIYIYCKYIYCKYIIYVYINLSI